MTFEDIKKDNVVDFVEMYTYKKVSEAENKFKTRWEIEISPEKISARQIARKTNAQGNKLYNKFVFVAKPSGKATITFDGTLEFDFTSQWNNYIENLSTETEHSV